MENLRLIDYNYYQLAFLHFVKKKSCVCMFLLKTDELYYLFTLRFSGVARYVSNHL